MKAEAIEKAKAEAKEKARKYAENAGAVTEFMASIAAAKAVGEDWVETSADVIQRMMPQGLGGAKFFIYQGIKVCEYGQKEAVEADMDRPVGERLHGSGEGKVG
jgi:hypothetical protein